MRLSGHSQNDGLRRALPLIARLKPETWVALDPPGDAAHAVKTQGTRLIVRHYWQPYDFNEGGVREAMADDPLVAAVRFVMDCEAQSWWPSAWAVMTPPAMAVPTSPPDLLEWAIQFQGWVYVLLREQARECIVCNVPNQNHGYYIPSPKPQHPDPNNYGCQEYFWDPNTSGLTEYRAWFPQKILTRNPQAKLYILECGATALLANPPAQPDDGASHGADIGFRGGSGVQALDRDYFLGRLFRYAAESDDYVVGRHYYQAGGNADWATHEALGDGGFEDFWVVQDSGTPAGGLPPGDGQPAQPGSTSSNGGLSMTATGTTFLWVPPQRTDQQQLIVDVVGGTARELAAPRMTKKRRLNLSAQLTDVTLWLERDEFPPKA